jgi:hypothetical protein
LDRKDEIISSETISVQIIALTLSTHAKLPSDYPDPQRLEEPQSLLEISLGSR